jgi:hypothetical protein
LDKLNQDKENTIASIATCLGNCETPVNEYIMQNYLAMLNDGKTELPRNIIEKMALTNYIQNKLGKQLPENERIECLHGLINCMYLSDSHPEYHFAPIKIEDRENFADSTTKYVQYGFNAIKGKKVLDNFIELCCKKEGDKIVRDEEKIDSIYEDFLAKNGIVSEKQKIINKCIEGINNNENYKKLCEEHYDKKDVVELIESIAALPDRFKKETSGMSDKDDINKVCKNIVKETIVNIKSVRASSNLYNFNHYSSTLTMEQGNLKNSDSLPNVNHYTNKEESKRRSFVSGELNDDNESNFDNILPVPDHGFGR